MLLVKNELQYWLSSYCTVWVMVHQHKQITRCYQSYSKPLFFTVLTTLWVSEKHDTSHWLLHRNLANKNDLQIFTIR